MLSLAMRALRRRLTEWAACLPAGQSRLISLDNPAPAPLT